MRSYLLDTSVIVDYLRNKPDALDLVNNLDGEITSSFVCLAELYEGVFRVKNKVTVENGVVTFFEGLTKIYGLDEYIAHTFGEIRAGLKQQGKVIEDLDILIGATCLVNNLTLVTFNPGHFQRISNLEVMPSPHPKN